MIIQFTNHPLVDVGAATIAAFAGKDDPTQVVEDELERLTSYIEQHYTVKPMRSFLTMLFPNSAYTNPSMLPDKRQQELDKVLRSWRLGTPQLDRPCSFCHQPAVLLAYRENIPLLGSRNSPNFYPEGNPGLPVCGACILAIQATALGTVNCAGRVLFVHSDQPAVTLSYAQAFLRRNQRAIESHRDKMPVYGSARTLIVEILVEGDGQYGA